MKPHGSPVLPAEVTDRVLRKLEVTAPSSPDLAALNALYAAWSCRVPFDNVQKCIWFAGDQAKPVTGGEPVEFFENWLAHGSGGTCWPVGGAWCALLQVLGFNARRIAGAMIEPGEEEFQEAGHGTVMVAVDGVDYLVDACMLAFEALPLIPGKTAAAGPGIHAIRARSGGNGFYVHWYSGINRREAVRFRPQLAYDPVDHAFFLERYAASTCSGPFNHGLFVCRRFLDSIVSISRNKKFTVSQDGQQTVTEFSGEDRRRVLIDELGFSEEIVSQLGQSATP